ncbi:uncharacterized protein CEXT_202401 [Caerostris extrusa]|uniref:Uncharacterized protein n=1 Tax=Caerostris extrusa TaxID=172846 RepID=A0AAV4R992_CAEEX|nr:uncharacterized protein CEXT_202401 [Caerostris extrusa]
MTLYSKLPNHRGTKSQNYDESFEGAFYKQTWNNLSQKGKDDDDQNKRFLSFKTKPETLFLHPPQWTDPLPVRMRVAQSKQPRTPENPVCVEEQHQLGCEASCWWSSASWALELVDYRISRRRFSAAQDRLLTDYQILVYHLLEYVYLSVPLFACFPSLIKDSRSPFSKMTIFVPPVITYLRLAIWTLLGNGIRDLSILCGVHDAAWLLNLASDELNVICRRA